ncbi:hypothetical protein L484_005825 [Morus notabilis]|uniref:Uncharacterized protein n=1 Tax=Morus notabilis TaxID=981085 RepID=W9RZ37_9ROSA|nr:UPF0481 protein At3g47200 [Morus notabilis]EXC00012.1 hypothetical protein L484_005825 [Morus notabilis]
MSRSHEHAISMEDRPEKAVHQGKSTSADDEVIIATLPKNVKDSPVYKKLQKSIEAKKAKKSEEEDIKMADARAKEKPKIQKVPAALKEKEKFRKYYEPQWISIGPIHHGKENLVLAENQYKPELVAKFINDGGTSIEALYNIIKDKIKELKESFDKDVIKGYDDDTLSWLLFYDGCSTLQFINSYVKINGNELRILSIKNDQIAYVQQDLFLLENQIPFEVLKLLMESRKDAEILKSSVKDFIRCNVMTPNKYKKTLEIELETDPEPAHLLELLRSAILQQPREHPRSNLGEKLSHSLDKAITLFPCKNYWPLNKYFTEGNDQGQQSFRSVQDLISAGIDLKPSGSCSLRDIRFTSLCFAGWLRLPPITVDDSTGPRFLNLIAYEMCPDNFRTDYEVISYISFLDSLIDYPVDVKELRSSHILHNLLGCDNDVALLFNEIATDLVPSQAVYKDVIAQIQSHYKSKWRTWMAQVYHDHFSSPWTIVAFLAAVVALGMSGIQTWYTVKS